MLSDSLARRWGIRRCWRSRCRRRRTCRTRLSLLPRSAPDRSRGSPWKTPPGSGSSSRRRPSAGTSCNELRFLKSTYLQGKVLWMFFSKFLVLMFKDVSGVIILCVFIFFWYATLRGKLVKVTVKGFEPMTSGLPKSLDQGCFHCILVFPKKWKPNVNRF